MSHVRTKLSVEDKDILKKIYTELEKITIPTSFASPGTKGVYHATKTGAREQRDARQTVFGIISYRGKKGESRSSKKYPLIFPMFKEFMNSHKPNFKFSSVYVNRNVVCKKHLDAKNSGESLLVGLGNYTGGQTTLFIDGKSKKFHIKSQSLIFNGSEIPHQSEKFKGIRYSLVFFK